MRTIAKQILVAMMLIVASSYSLESTAQVCPDANARKLGSGTEEFYYLSTPMSGRKSYSNAVADCKANAAGSGIWRLPTVAEMEQIAADVAIKGGTVTNGSYWLNPYDEEVSWFYISSSGASYIITNGESYRAYFVWRYNGYLTECERNPESCYACGGGGSTTILVSNVTISTPGDVTTVAMGGTLAFTADVLPADATNKSVLWEVENGTGSAIITSSGVLYPLTTGTVTVKATAQDGSGETSSYNMTVVIAVTNVSVSPKAISLTIGATQQLTATVLPENATNKNITWSSSNESVATVDDTGLVNAVANGEATITATTEDGNRTDAAVVTVSASEPVEFRITECTYWDGVVDISSAEIATYVGSPERNENGNITVHVEGNGEITYQWYTVTGYGYPTNGYEGGKSLLSGKTNNFITISNGSDTTGDIVVSGSSCSWFFCYCVITQNIDGVTKEIKSKIFIMNGWGVCPP